MIPVFGALLYLRESRKFGNTWTRMPLKCMATEGSLCLSLRPHPAGTRKMFASELSAQRIQGSCLGAGCQGCDIYYYEYHLY